MLSLIHVAGNRDVFFTVTHVHVIFFFFVKIRRMTHNDVLWWIKSVFTLEILCLWYFKCLHWWCIILQVLYIWFGFWNLLPSITPETTLGSGHVWRNRKAAAKTSNERTANLWSLSKILRLQESYKVQGNIKWLPYMNLYEKNLCFFSNHDSHARVYKYM